MFAYYFRLGVSSLKRNVVLTILMITAIAVGIGASMTALTVFRAMSGDPIPQKSSQLYAPQIDNVGPKRGADVGTDDGLTDQIDYIDAMAFMKAHAAKRQSALYLTRLSVRPPDPHQKPFKVLARAAYTEFFPMFDAPFKFGGPWTAADDEGRSAVVVLTREMNDKLFGGADSVGKTLRLDDELYTVRGVLRDWHPTPQFYDLHIAPFGGSDEVFLPFNRAIDKHMGGIGNTSCYTSSPVGWDAFLQSDCVWLQFWVELPDTAAALKYRSFLGNYAAEQQRSGRFDWPARAQLRAVMPWLKYRHVVPSEVNILLLMSFGFLLVCLLNAMGLMLAKIMGRAGDIGVRRALGASRRAIFTQCLIETSVVGLAGGIFGLVLTGLGLLAARSFLAKEFVSLTHLDFADVAVAVVLGIVATVIAGLYPTWRAAHGQPAWQIKAQ
jgi:putative ABC transport system permease protein